MGGGASVGYHPTMDKEGTNVRIEASGPAGDFVVKNGNIPECPAKGLVIKVNDLFYFFG